MAINQRWFHATYMGISSASLCLSSFQIAHVDFNWKLISLVAVMTSLTYLIYWNWVEMLHDKIGIHWNAIPKVIFRKPLLFFSFVTIGFILVLVMPIRYSILCTVLIGSYFLLPYVSNILFGSRMTGFFKTCSLALIWALVTTLLPLPETQEMRGLFLLLFQRFFFMMPLSILYDQKDREVDCRKGRYTMATIFSDKMLYFFHAICLLFYLIISLKMHSVKMASLFTLILPFFLLLISLSIMSFVELKKNWVYYLAVDGLMIYSPLLGYIGSFYLPL